MQLTCFRHCLFSARPYLILVRHCQKKGLLNSIDLVGRTFHNVWFKCESHMQRCRRWTKLICGTGKANKQIRQSKKLVYSSKERWILLFTCQQQLFVKPGRVLLWRLVHKINGARCSQGHLVTKGGTWLPRGAPGYQVKLKVQVQSGFRPQEDIPQK